MRILVCGGRKYGDRYAVAMALAYLAKGREDVTLVHGDCRGADRLAAKVARDWGWKVEPHPADTKRYGSPQAFHVRNQEMVDAGADLLVAFPGGNGTADCTRRARKAGIRVKSLAFIEEDLFFNASVERADPDSGKAGVV